MPKNTQRSWLIFLESKYEGHSLPAFHRRLALTATLWVLLSSANFVDYFATQHALSHGCIELNPFIAALLQIKRFDAFLIAKSIFPAILLVLFPFFQGWKLSLLAVATLIYLAVVMYQLYGIYLLDFM